MIFDVLRGFGAGYEREVQINDLSNKYTQVSHLDTHLSECFLMLSGKGKVVELIRDKIVEIEIV